MAEPHLQEQAPVLVPHSSRCAINRPPSCLLIPDLPNLRASLCSRSFRPHAAIWDWAVRPCRRKKVPCWALLRLGTLSICGSPPFADQIHQRHRDNCRIMSASSHQIPINSLWEKLQEINVPSGYLQFKAESSKTVFLMQGIKSNNPLGSRQVIFSPVSTLCPGDFSLQRKQRTLPAPSSGRSAPDKVKNGTDLRWEKER